MEVDPEAVSENQVSKSTELATHTTAEGALLLALGGAEAAAGVPFAGVFVRDSVGGYAANVVEPDPSSRSALRLCALPVHNLPTT